MRNWECWEWIWIWEIWESSSSLTDLLPWVPACLRPCFLRSLLRCFPELMHLLSDSLCVTMFSHVVSTYCAITLNWPSLFFCWIIIVFCVMFFHLRLCFVAFLWLFCGCFTSINKSNQSKWILWYAGLICWSDMRRTTTFVLPRQRFDVRRFDVRRTVYPTLPYTKI